MKTAFLILFSMMISSCSFRQQKGYQFADIEKIRSFRANNSSKKDVLQNLGKPQVELEDDVWLYYSYVYKNPRMLKNKLDSEAILIVYFGAGDRITKHNFTEREFRGKITDIKGSDREEKTKLLNEIFNDVSVVPITQ